MIVNSTDLKNNLGKYLRLSAREDIIITSNGRKIAKLTAWENPDKPTVTGAGILREQAENYEVAPRKISYEEFSYSTTGFREKNAGRFSLPLISL
jgi:prevent-host-death family protein